MNVNKQYHAKNALIWEGIKSGCAKGYNSFNFGTVLKGNQGLLNFKRHFGADIKSGDFYYNNTGTAPKMENFMGGFRLAKMVWRRLPLRLTEFGGNKLRKWIC